MVSIKIKRKQNISDGNKANSKLEVCTQSFLQRGALQRPSKEIREALKAFKWQI